MKSWLLWPPLKQIKNVIINYAQEILKLLIYGKTQNTHIACLRPAGNMCF